MRFLCLHGGGTNNRIFELQTAALRYELGSKHTFEFVEGSLPAPIAPGAESLAAAGDEYFAYFYPHEPKTIQTALHELHEYLVEEGPFDGVIAFSQGCGLAATYMIQQHLTNTNAPIWKYAVLFSGEPGEVIGEQEIDLDTDGIIDVPTLHIRGAKDFVNPTRNALLDKQCSGKSKSNYVHQGAHEVPTSNKEVTEIAHLIRRLF